MTLYYLTTNALTDLILLNYHCINWPYTYLTTNVLTDLTPT